jgi:capsular exopolysaccharide synthesis family protein
VEPLAASAQAGIPTYLRVLNRRKLIVLATLLVVVALTLAYSLIEKPTYTASAQVLVPEQAPTSALDPTVNQQLPAASSLQRTLLDAQQFAQGDATNKAARAILHRKAKVSVGASATSDMLTFTANSGNKTYAAAIANAYANAYITANRNNQISQYTQQVTALQGSIAQLQQKASALPAGSTQQTADQTSIASLNQALQQLQAASQLATQTGPSMVDAATAPLSPSSPKPLRNGLLAVVVGLLLGVGLAFLRDRFDDKIKSLRDAEDSSSGNPVIGVIPLVDSWRGLSETHLALIEDPTSTVSEAYRTLRTAIQFLGIDESQRIIGITSSTPGEGKSTTVANLAVSFARAGQRVVVLSCDFRRPRIHAFFGLDNQLGLTSVLLGEASMQDSFNQVPDEPNLRIFPSGPVPPNPAEILSLDRVRIVVETLAENADIVLLDCPPVLPVTDALLISRLCDTMLVVTAAVITKKGDLHRTYALLAQVQAPVRGTIVNRVPHRGAYAPDYGYGYGYGYQYSSSNATPPPGNNKTSSPSAVTSRESRRAAVGRMAAAEAASHGHASEAHTSEEATSRRLLFDGWEEPSGPSPPCRSDPPN